MKIKELFEDFIVYEVPSITKLKVRGRFTYFVLMKKDYTTISALKLVSKKVKIPLKYFGFAGNKDRHAITFQLCSVRFAGVQRLKNISLNDIKIIPVGKDDKPIKLGDLKGNYFKITVRDLDREIRVEEKDVPNFFDEQRFGKEGINICIGKLLVKKQFCDAASLIKNKELAKHLEKYPKDCIGALRKIPYQLLKLYVHAYQSWLWNECAKRVIEKGTEMDIMVPIIGFGIELERYPDLIKKVVKKRMKEDSITMRDFVFHQIPELSASGNDRKLFVRPKIISYKYAADELHKGKKKLTIKFFLPKGSYATNVIKFLLE